MDIFVRETLGFPDLLRLIDDRATAFRAAVAAAPSLDVQVPTCPEWTLFDLAQHLGEGRRALAATIAAGPDVTAKATPQGGAAAPREREALLAYNHAVVFRIRSLPYPARFSWTEVPSRAWTLVSYAAVERLS